MAFGKWMVVRVHILNPMNIALGELNWFGTSHFRGWSKKVVDGQEKSRGHEAPTSASFQFGTPKQGPTKATVCLKGCLYWAPYFFVYFRWTPHPAIVAIRDKRYVSQNRRSHGPPWTV